MSTKPWAAILNGQFVGRASTRQAAMNLIDRPYQAGAGRIERSRTGETWRRRGGSWFRVAASAGVKTGVAA